MRLDLQTLRMLAQEAIAEDLREHPEPPEYDWFEEMEHGMSFEDWRDDC